MTIKGQQDKSRRVPKHKRKKYNSKKSKKAKNNFIYKSRKV